MASPFSLFRKNQKVMMAALVLLAMFAFVLSSRFTSVWVNAALK